MCPILPASEKPDSRAQRTPRFRAGRKKKNQAEEGGFFGVFSCSAARREGAPPRRSACGKSAATGAREAARMRHLAIPSSLVIAVVTFTGVHGTAIRQLAATLRENPSTDREPSEPKIAC
jgi:hypothetical protein